MTRIPCSAWLPIFLVLLAFPPGVCAQEKALPADAPARAPAVAPFERPDPVPAGPLDERVLAALREKGIEPAHSCSDVVFVRRVFLDIIGTLPSLKEIRGFLHDKNPGKRAALIDALLARDEFADYWSMKWCDLLRVKSEFPINLWPNAVQAYARWIHQSLRTNMPYDSFVRELLTSSGSNFRVPPVNFYRALQGKSPQALARVAALTFMGARIETWPEERRLNLEAFFSRVAFKGTQEWKEEIVFLDPAPAGPLQGVFPDGTRTTIPPDQDPRKAFAQWLITPKNQWFARNIVNRVWSWLLGRGVIHEADDIRPDNPPSNPALLSFLEKELVRARYDLRHLFRIILNSRTYQQSSIPQSRHEEAEALFAFYPVRRLEAEVLADAIRGICGVKEQYLSMIPEPFTFIPQEKRSITLTDGSITSSILELFGRPSRDTGLESERNNRPTEAQRLFLINSSGIQKGLMRSPWLRWLMRLLGNQPVELVKTLFMTILSRNPTEAELAAVGLNFQGKKTSGPDAVIDLAWALLNSKEFLYRH